MEKQKKGELRAQESGDIASLGESTSPSHNFLISTTFQQRKTSINKSWEICIISQF